MQPEPNPEPTTPLSEKLLVEARLKTESMHLRRKQELRVQFALGLATGNALLFGPMKGQETPASILTLAEKLTEMVFILEAAEWREFAQKARETRKEAKDGKAATTDSENERKHRDYKPSDN